jgi:prevent-host-death family protein
VAFFALSMKANIAIMYVSDISTIGARIMNVVDIRNNLADAINRVAYAGERIVLERRGKGVAALVSIEDLELLQELEDQADIRAARKALKEKGGISLEDFKKKHGL